MRKYQISTAFILTFALFTNVSAASFPDVRATVYEDAYTYLSEKNVVQGYSDGFGRPNYPISRSEAVKVIVAANPNLQKKVEWYQQHMPPLPLFTDVQQAEWYAPYVEIAFENKVVTGYPNKTFKPGNSVTVEEAVAMILRANDPGASTTEYRSSPYIQNTKDQWYSPFVSTGIARNLFMSKGKLYPGTAITRGQFFDILYRMDYVARNNAVAFQETAGPVAAVQTRPISADYNQPVVTQPVAPYQPTVAQQPVLVAGQYSQYVSQKPFAISIPSVGIHDLEIIHPDDPFSSEGVLAPLQRGVGHLFSYPGGGGKIMVYGHSSSYPWDTSEFSKIFRKINEAKPGDKIYVTYDGTLHVYEVTYEEAVPAEDTSRFNDNGQGEELILYTCWPPDSITQRYLVHAVPVDQVALR